MQPLGEANHLQNTTFIVYFVLCLEIGTPEFVRDVVPIFMAAAITEDRETLAYIVEAPLVLACQDLFDKSVRSVVSSANANDIQTGFAYITLDCSTMSEENTSIVNKLKLKTSSLRIPEGGELLLGLLKFPIREDTRVQELSRRALESTGLFKFQEKLWA